MKKMNKEKCKGIIIGIIFTLTIGLFASTPYAETIAKHIRVVYPNVNLVVNNKKFIPRDDHGETIQPFIYNDNTYLPIRAIGEALDKDVSWDANTKTIKINDKSSKKSGLLNPQIFLENNKVLGDRDFVVGESGVIKVNNADFNYKNKVFGPLDYKGFYNVDKKYSKIRGVLVHGDKGEGMYGHNFTIKGDGNLLFNGSKFLKSKGFKDGLIPKGNKDQPIEFEVNISDINLLELDFGYYATIYNLEFIK